MSKKITFEKPPVVSWRIRRVPCGFGWADHRLLRNGFLRLCTPDAMALYLLLILAADGNGMSFYGDRLLCSTLGLSGQRLESARDNLLHADLVAWQAPFYQVLELPAAPEGGTRDDA